MNVNASDVLVETLLAWGIDVVFGLPGDGINGIMEALRKRRDVIRFIQVRHEDAASFMACGYAKHTGRLGCCVATSGPGGIHLLNGLYDAKLDGQPVLAITGIQFHDLTYTHSQQDVELDKLFQNVCVYNARCMGPAHMENIANLACRTAVKYKLPIKIVVVKNNTLGQIRWEQMAFLGNPEYGCELSPIDFAEVAHACGATGFTLEDPKECATTLARAFDTPGPVVIDALVDANEPPVPASVSSRQAINFAEALARGTHDLSQTTHAPCTESRP